MPKDLIVFVPVGSRVRYAETRYLTDESSVVVMPSDALTGENEKFKIPDEYAAALNAEPVFDAQRYVDTDALLDRLMHAEHVCAMYGWCPARTETDREAATHELWAVWVDHVQSSTGNPDFPTPEDFRYLSDELIAELAARRRATRDATLARIEGDLTSDGDGETGH